MSFRIKSEDLEHNHPLAVCSNKDDLAMSSKSPSSSHDTQSKNSELELLVSNLRSQIESLKLRVKLEEDGEVIRSVPEPTKFSLNLIDRGGNYTFQFTYIPFNNVIVKIIKKNIGWLIGLLFFQSCSSFILSANNELIKDHPAIIYFLTMLVGAGGNAGNQAAVRVIRRIALGTLTNRNMISFLLSELRMAFCLCTILGFFGYIRCVLTSVHLHESIVITIALMSIVFISIVFGALLPLLLQYMKIDPAHSSTTIQVIMDILGVLISCSVATALLDTDVGRTFLRMFG
jgi:cation transporter-like permease